MLELAVVAIGFVGGIVIAASLTGGKRRSSGSGGGANSATSYTPEDIAAYNATNWAALGAYRTDDMSRWRSDTGDEFSEIEQQALAISEKQGGKTIYFWPPNPMHPNAKIRCSAFSLAGSKMINVISDKWEESWRYKARFGPVPAGDPPGWS